LTIINEVAVVPPKLTTVVPVKFVPGLDVLGPVAALGGGNDVIVGAGINVKPAIDAIPPGVVTLTLPEAPVATTAVIVVALTIINEVAVVPPKLTTVVPVKFVPVIVIVAPVAPLVGVNDVIAGAGININPASAAVPPGVVTLTEPVAPVPTTAVMVVALTTVNEVAAVPPKLTAVAPVKFVPVIDIVVPVPALVGVKEVIVGAGIKIKPGLVAVPLGVVTLTEPVAPVPTTAVIVVDLTTMNDAAAIPPKLTAVAPMKLDPVMVIVALVGAEVGLNEIIKGANVIASAPISTGVKPLLTSLSKSVVSVLAAPPAASTGDPGFT